MAWAYIDSISDANIVKRLNTGTMEFWGKDSGSETLQQLYMEDGRHYEDEYPRILSLLEKEAERRGLTTTSTEDIPIGEIVQTIHGSYKLTEIHEEKDNNYVELHRVDKPGQIRLSLAKWRKIRLYLNGKEGAGV